MATDRSEVRTFLKNWANTRSKPHFAVLVEGRWGCGKTHFILDLLEDKSFSDRRPIYLSVFGVADIQSLEVSIFYASASKLTKMFHKGAGLAGSIFSGALTFGSGGLLGGAANLNKVVDAATSQLERSAKNMDGALLVLDDLERCQIPMAELMGVVNRFVEHGDTRVILMANTNNLKDKHFATFREKVVGHSFLLASDPDSALASFIAKLDQPYVREVLKRYHTDIRELYDISGYHNLRALRQFVWQLATLIERMDDDYRQNDNLIKNLINQFFIFFIEFKLDLSDEATSLQPSDLLTKNEPHEDDVRYVYEFSFNKEEKPSPKKHIINKYKQNNGIRTVISVQQWVSILSSGVVDGDRLNRELALSDEVAGVGSWPSWKRLWHLNSWDFSDGSEREFWQDVGDLQSNLNNGAYVDVGEFLHVVGVSIMLAEQELVDKTVANTVADLKIYIDDHFIPNLTDERCRRLMEEFSHHFDAYDGLGFMRREEADFQEVLKYLTKKVDAWHQAWLSTDAGKQLLGFLTDDWIRFFGNLTVINHAPEQRYLDAPILATIDVETFVDSWLNLSRVDELLVVGVLRDRYEYRPNHLIPRAFGGVACKKNSCDVLANQRANPGMFR